MRNLLLASAAMLGAASGIASAQAPQPAGATMMMAPSQGMTPLPWAQGPTADNNNNSYGQPSTYSGGAAFGKNAVPTPGTVVIRLNGKVEVDMVADWNTGNTVQTSDGKVYKANPVSFGSFMRLYPGVDGMATNGLRYGASIELRQNFESGNTYAFTGNAVATPAAGATLTPGGNTIGTAAASPSGNSSAQTVFVRRAFTYLAADNFGIVRFGTGDGVIGLFDPGIYSSATWDAGSGSFNGGSIQSLNPGSAIGIPFAWLAQAGAEYGNVKVVYISPQFFGLDVGVQYAPSMGNGYQNGVTGSPVQATTCNAAGTIQSATQSNSGCVGTTSGNDPTRWYNQVAVGARWQGSLGPVDLGVYAVYETAGKEQLSGPATGTLAAPGSAARIGGANGAFRYDNLSFVSAATFATLNTGVGSFTWAFDYIGGALNGQLAMRPTGGVPENAFLSGLVYKNGPVTLGLEAGLVQSQGAAQLVGISQRREFEVAFGGNYNIAPGMYLVGEYMYTYRHQGGYDFTGACVSGSSNCLSTHAGSTRDGRGQGIMFSTVVNW
jgi:hypothetical protein